MNSHPSAKLTALSSRISSATTESTAPYRWLALGVQDFRRAPLISLAYGTLFTLLPALLLLAVFQSDTYLVVLPAMVACALIGPAFATGLYAVAAQLEQGQQPTLKSSWNAMMRHPVGEWGVALMLTLLLLLWLRISLLVHALYPSFGSHTLESFLPFLIVGGSVGGVLLTVVFLCCAFAPQLALDKGVDPISATLASARTVLQQPLCMALWAMLIVLAIGVGFATATIGFVVIMPVLSYASWHAYRELFSHSTP